ncbi:MAG: phosphatidylinositol dimannoside acyltransferase [Acidobacteriota bacterium]
MTSGEQAVPRRRGVEPRRWTLHGLNNGRIFTATCAGVRALPRPVSYAIGHVGTWIAWRLTRQARRAVVDNLRPLFPDDDERTLTRRALDTYRAYARDIIDFLRASSLSPAEARDVFVASETHRQVFVDLLAEGRGIILVTGHYGNWEIGSILIRDALQLPLTVVAMMEANPEVNQARRAIREALGVETLEVRQTLETALQLRRQLAANRIVAMLVDRHLGRDRVAVRFLGREASFLRTPALLAYMTGAPIVPCFIERVGPGRFAAEPGTPIRVGREGSRGAAIQAATQEIADALAARVRRHPEYWYHFYRYWDAQQDAYDGLE